MFTDPDLVPFEPPPQPLGLRGLPVMWRNYIESIPRGAYEDGVVRIRRRHADTILVCEPELIGEMLVEKAENFERDAVTRRAFAPTIGRNSLFLAEGAEWRWQRRAVAPIFRHEALMSFLPVFTAMAERQAEQWRKAPRGEPVDAAAAMTRTTFDIIVETMLGGSANLDADRYSRAIKDSFETIPWHIIYAQLGCRNGCPIRTAAAPPARAISCIRKSAAPSRRAAAPMPSRPTCSICCSRRATRKADAA